MGSAIAAGAIGASATLPFGRTVFAQDGGTEFHGAWPYLEPPTGHFNTFVTDGIMNPPNIYGEMIYMPFGLFYWQSQEWLPLLATEWGFAEDGENFTITIREGVQWSDGTPFTVDDVLATFSLLRLMSNTVWGYIDEVTAVDDLVVNFHMSKPSTVVERYVVRMCTRPASVFGEWAAKADELFASGKTIDDPEGTQLLEQFSAFRPEAALANGPFVINLDLISNAQLTLDKNPTGYLADTVPYDKIVLFNGETDVITPVVLAKEVDYATHGFAPASEQQMLADGIRVLRPPTYGGPALLFNYGKFPDAFNDKKVRQAIAHVLDQSQIGQIALADSGVDITYMAGFSDQLVPLWLDEAAVTGLNPYEVDLEKAAALLTEAGWTKDGDTWMTPTGDPAAFEISFPAEYADNSAAGQDVANQLNEFGFQIEPRAITFTQHPIDVDKGAFDLAVRGWGNSSNPHPHFSYHTAFFVHNTLAINNGGKGMQFPLTQTTEVAGEVDLEELTLNAALGLDEAAQKKDVTTIAQAFNELMPIIPMYERYGNNAALEGVRVTAWPPDNDPILINSPYADGIVTILMLTGKLVPV